MWYNYCTSRPIQNFERALCSSNEARMTPRNDFPQSPPCQGFAGRFWMAIDAWEQDVARAIPSSSQSSGRISICSRGIII